MAEYLSSFSSSLLVVEGYSPVTAILLVTRGLATPPLDSLVGSSGWCGELVYSHWVCSIWKGPLGAGVLICLGHYHSDMASRKRAASTGKATTQSPFAGSSAATSNKKEANRKCLCPICDEAILDAVGSKPGEDSVQCDGICATWLHRRCAGLSKVAFDIICKSADPFYCPQCKLGKQDLELKSLRDLINNLSSHLSLVADELASLKAGVIGKPGTDKGSVAASVTGVSSQASPSTTSPRDSSSRDRKFNLIIHGVQEPCKGTPKHQRVMKDFADVCELLSKLVTNISADSIRDSYRLGKYKPERNRPIMVKFVRCHDVIAILSSKSKLSAQSGVSIKPDLTPQERQSESLLLKERRALINSGVDRKAIKIRGNALFVNLEKHGSVINSTLQRVSPITLNDLQVGESSLSPSPIQPSNNGSSQVKSKFGLDVFSAPSSPLFSSDRVAPRPDLGSPFASSDLNAPNNTPSSTAVGNSTCHSHCSPTSK